MLKQLILLLGTLCLFTACEVEKPQPTILADNLNGTLRIQYTGSGDIVTCRLFDRVATMEKIEEAHFQLSVQVENLDSSVFGFYINSYKLNNDNKSELIESYTHKWRGSILPKFLESDQLTGAYQTDSLFDPLTKAYRSYSMYLPNLDDYSLDTLNVVIMTDGEALPRYYKYVDQLIHQKNIHPVALFGLHSTQGKSEGHSIRYLEYVKTDNASPYFLNHEAFFIEAFLPFIENTLDKYGSYLDLSLYGYSNGGAFCTYLGLNYPDKFEHIVAFSTAGYISEFYNRRNYTYLDYPYFYLGAGKYESSILGDNQFFCNELEANKLSYEFHEFNSGHDYITWRYEFLTFLTKSFN